MAAYAALVSLMHIIDDIEHHPSPPICMDKQQVQSLIETVLFLQEFLEGYKSPVAVGDEADSLEMRIADAAYAAEDAIESHIVNKAQLSRSKETKDASESHIVEKGQLSRSEEAKISCFFNCFRDPKNDSSNHDDEQINLYQDVQKLIEEMDQIKKEATESAAEAQLQRKVSSTRAGSLTSSSTVKKSIMVGFDDVSLELLDRLTEGHHNDWGSFGKVRTYTGILGAQTEKFKLNSEL